MCSWRRSFAGAWAKDNIQVNAILRGWVDNELTRKAREQMAGLNEKRAARMPVQRWARRRFRRHRGVSRKPGIEFHHRAAIADEGSYSVNGLATCTAHTTRASHADSSNRSHLDRNAAGREDEARAFYHGFLGLDGEGEAAALIGAAAAGSSMGALQVHRGVEKKVRPARKAHPAFMSRIWPAGCRKPNTTAGIVSEDEPLEGCDRCHVDDEFGNRIALIEPHQG